MESISEWELEGKIYGLTTDNAPACILAGKLLQGTKSKKSKNHYQRSIQFFNRCSAHSIQLVVKWGLKLGIKKNTDQYLNIILDNIR